jgi:DNA-binding NarL/FixJ family response regulator
MRLGLRQLIGSLPNIEIVAESTHTQNLPPLDVWVLASADLLPAGGEHPALLLLSNDPEDASQLVKFPLWGILPLETSESELEAAIRALAEGLCVGAPALLTGLLARRSRPDVESADLTAQPLTGRELEVLQLAAEGMANKQIALSLGISEHTVKFHLSSIYAKLGVTGRTEAIRAGARRGLVVM